MRMIYHFKKGGEMQEYGELQEQDISYNDDPEGEE